MTDFPSNSRPDPAAPECRCAQEGEGGGPKGRGCGGGSGLGAGGFCVCRSCGYREAHERGVPCREKKCPRCGTPLRREP